MKKIGLLLMFFVALCTKMMADTGETVTINGTIVDRFAVKITFNGDNLTLNYADGTQVTVDMALVDIHFNYTADLSDAHDNSNAETLNMFGGKNVGVTVTRNVTAGQWNTLCLPFDMTAEQITSAFGSGTKVAQFKNAVDGNIAYESTTTIEAGMPYLIQPALSVTEFALDEVTLQNLTSGAEVSNQGYAFIGTIPETTPSGNVFYFANGNKLKPLNSGNSIKALHAFLLSEDAAVNAVTFSVDEEPTGIMTIDGQVTTGDNRIFNLQGQYMGRSLIQLPKGIYIVNGKKVTVK
ncbi:MAG: hypothetical protein IKT00_08625 [Prevotella sp.]|nr:hypothetical protein [Prevotella sp.]